MAALLSLAVNVGAQDQPIAFSGARLIPIVGEPIENALLLVQNGKIRAVGDARTVRFAADVRIVDLSGKVIMPGLVDSHSHIGGTAGADGSNPIQPDVRVLDSLDARSSSIQKAQAGGITTVNVMPGSGHLISGQTLYLKLRDGRIIDDLLITLDDGRIAGGLKMANGTNSLRGTGNFPGTRAKSAALMREQFIKAQEYQAKIDRAKGDLEKLPPRDLALEMLAEVLARKRVVQFHTHRHDDILTVLRLRKEFGFDVVLHHVSDAWKVADEIARAGVASSIIIVDSPGGKLETRDLSFTSAAALERAGARIGLHTDDGVTDSRHFLRMAGFAVRGGMSREGALRAVTLANAEMLGLANRVGSLEVGKDADFIILNGDPLSVYTQIEQTWIEGRKVFDFADPQDRLYALGGDGAGEPRRQPLCCYGNAWDIIANANAQLFGGAQ
jgi:imidazolonepropionase-like amidohydrolase